MNIDFSKVITVEQKAQQETNEIKDKIAERRYQEETRGVTVDGLYLNTERTSQGLLTGAALEAFMDDTYTCRWKTSEGFVDLDAPTLIKISRAMRQHVQSCFNREADLVKAVDDGTYTDDMLEEGWL